MKYSSSSSSLRWNYRFIRKRLKTDATDQYKNDHRNVGLGVLRDLNMQNAQKCAKKLALRNAPICALRYFHHITWCLNHIKTNITRIFPKITYLLSTLSPKDPPSISFSINRNTLFSLDYPIVWFCHANTSNYTSNAQFVAFLRLTVRAATWLHRSIQHAPAVMRRRQNRYCAFSYVILIQTFILVRSR